VVDYDAPRTSEVDGPPEQTVASLQASRAQAAAALGDETDPLEGGLDLAGADGSVEDSVVLVLPRQDDEFTCTSCYLVHHRSRLADARTMVCSECAG